MSRSDLSDPIPEAAILAAINAVRGLGRKRAPNIKGFVWMCKRRDVAKLFRAAVEATEGECNIIPKAPRCINGVWYGPRWLVYAWKLSVAEVNKLQKIAPALDPSAHGLVWDEENDCYVKKGKRK